LRFLPDPNCAGQPEATIDADAHYAGIGASAAAIARILTVADLDVVPTGRHEEIPHYR